MSLIDCDVRRKRTVTKKHHSITDLQVFDIRTNTVDNTTGFQAQTFFREGDYT